MRWYSTVSGYRIEHLTIPLTGTADEPTERTLYYRVRRVDRTSNRSGWSLPISITVRAVNIADIAAGAVNAFKLNEEMWKNLETRHLKAYWPMDDTNGGETPSTLGKFVDTSEHGDTNALVFSSGKEQLAGVAGKNGQALRFNGSSLISVKTNALRGETPYKGLTMMGWFRHLPAQPTADVTYFSYSNGSTGGSRFDMDLSVNTTSYEMTLTCSYGTTNAQLTTGPIDVFNLDAWQHIAFAFDKETRNAAIYVNGVSRAANVVGDTTLVLPDNGVVALGGRIKTGVVDRQISADVDDVRVFSKSLPDEQIKFYNLNFTGNTSVIISGDRILAKTIHAGLIEVGTINVQVQQIDNNLTIGSPGWSAGTRYGNFRAYLDRDEVAVQIRANSRSSWANMARMWYNSLIDSGELAISNSNQTYRNRIIGDQVIFEKRVGDGWSQIAAVRNNDTSLELDPGFITKNAAGQTRLVGDESGFSTYLNSAVKSVTMNAAEASISFYIGNTNTEYKLWMTGSHFNMNAPLKANGYIARVTKTSGSLIASQAWNLFSPALTSNSSIIVSGGGRGRDGTNLHHVILSSVRKSGSSMTIFGLDAGSDRDSVSQSFTSGSNTSLFTDCSLAL